MVYLTSVGSSKVVEINHHMPISYISNQIYQTTFQNFNLILKNQNIFNMTFSTKSNDLY